MRFTACGAIFCISSALLVILLACEFTQNYRLAKVQHDERSAFLEVLGEQAQRFGFLADEIAKCKDLVAIGPTLRALTATLSNNSALRGAHSLVRGWVVTRLVFPDQWQDKVMVGVILLGLAYIVASLIITKMNRDASADLGGSLRKVLVDAAAGMRQKKAAAASAVGSPAELCSK